MPLNQNLGRQGCPRSYVSAIWKGVCVLIAIYSVLLAVETVLRISFPWDMYFWSESPFLTNMIKLDHHLPVYTTPADGNSFVYSCGLEYICFALLKPFGLELDIRFCRAVVVALGLLGSALGSLAICRLLRSHLTGRRFFLVSMGCIWLVLGKNFMAEITHPDTLHACHALAVFWLCFTALETKSFRMAILTVVVAGFGVMTKQTNFLACCGPLAAFALSSAWNRKNWLILAVIGGVTSFGALYLLWLPKYGRFFTLTVVSHQSLSLWKVYHLAADLLSMDRAVLLILGIFAFFYLLRAGNIARRYLLVWCCVGFFSVLPNLAAFLKVMGTWNNLIVFEIWLSLIVWPSFVLCLNDLKNAPSGQDARGVAVSPWLLAAPLLLVMILFVALLAPIKVPPRASHYRFCREVQAGVTRDVAAGKKVLVSHGAEFLIRAGDKSVPRDLSNTILELRHAGYDDFSAFRSRLATHYYDRLYLIQDDWYGPEIGDDINKYYVEESMIRKSDYNPMAVSGFSPLMHDDCRVMVPRQ